MSMSDHIKQQVLQEFFCQKVSFSWKTAKLELFALPEWENSSRHIENILPVAVWHTVLICFTMCSTEQPKKQPQIGDRGSNPVAINQFLIYFFLLLGSHVLVLFSHLLIFFILRGLLHFIFNFTLKFFAQLFLLKMKKK